MGQTPTYGLPFPDLYDPPNGPAQMSQEMHAVMDELVRVDGLVNGLTAILAQFTGDPNVPAAPASTAGRDAYPNGFSARSASSSDGYPTNGVLLTLNYPTPNRTAQILTSANIGSTVIRQFTRQWGSGAAWTNWAETTAPPRSKSGLHTVNMGAAATSHLVTVPLGENLGVAPECVTAVVASAVGPAGVDIRTDLYTPIQFRLQLYFPSSTQWTGVPIRWHAVAGH